MGVLLPGFEGRNPPFKNTGKRTFQEIFADKSLNKYSPTKRGGMFPGAAVSGMFHTQLA
jgi:hypothetical protein